MTGGSREGLRYKKLSTGSSSAMQNRSGRDLYSWSLFDVLWGAFLTQLTKGRSSLEGCDKLRMKDYARFSHEDTLRVCSTLQSKLYML